MKKSENSPAGRSSAPDYRIYQLGKSEYIRLFLTATLLLTLAAYTFYHSLLLIVLLLPAAIAYPFFMKGQLLKKRQNLLLFQFREALQLLNSYLGAGFSAENAFRKTLPELVHLYGKNAMITEEFIRIQEGMNLNKPLDSLLDDFAFRSGLDDIQNFAEIFRLAKQNGGELIHILRHTSSVISDKVSLHQEIMTMNASRQYEQKVMNLVPFLILLYLNISSPDFFTPLYTGILGRLIMTGCLSIYLVAVYLSQKILDISI